MEEKLATWLVGALFALMTINLAIFAALSHSALMWLAFAAMAALTLYWALVPRWLDKRFSLKKIASKARNKR